MQHITQVKKTFEAKELEVICKANTTKVSALIWDKTNDPSRKSSYISEEVGLLASESGKYTLGVTYTCNVGDGDRTFYILEENGDNVSLILGTTLENYARWSSDENACAAVIATESLYEQTSGWTKLNSEQVNLPSAYQIATASGISFDANSVSSIPGIATWLNSYTDINFALQSWTSTNKSNSNYCYNVWYVSYDDKLSTTYGPGYSRGIRPVITISKTQLG